MYKFKSDIKVLATARDRFDKRLSNIQNIQ